MKYFQINKKDLSMTKWDMLLFQAWDKVDLVVELGGIDSQKSVRRVRLGR